MTDTAIAEPTPAVAHEANVAELQAEIRELAKQKNAIILAHNYQLPEIQDVAHITGDSLGLSLEAKNTDADTIVFCGVHFMAESAKLLNPEKTVLLPNLAAGCSLADSITPESLDDWKERYPGRKVVTYINSTAATKAESHICCTSANAVSVARSLGDEPILFTPDRNLGAWVAKQMPEKDIVIYDGCCPIHDVLRGANVDKSKSNHPDAVIIAHPECREDVIAMADEVCSTTAMIDRVGKYPDAKTFLIATENGMLHQLKLRHPDKEFVMADGCIGCRLNCPYMKVTSLQDVRRSLLEGVHEVVVDERVAEKARLSLERMLAVPRDN